MLSFYMSKLECQSTIYLQVLLSFTTVSVASTLKCNSANPCSVYMKIRRVEMHIEFNICIMGVETKIRSLFFFF